MALSLPKHLENISRQDSRSFVWFGDCILRLIPAVLNAHSARDQQEAMYLPSLGQKSKTGNLTTFINVLRAKQLHTRIRGRNESVQIDHRSAVLPQKSSCGCTIAHPNFPTICCFEFMPPARHYL